MKIRTPADLPTNASLELQALFHINQLLGSHIMFTHAHAVDVLCHLRMILNLQKSALVLAGIPEQKIEKELEEAYIQHRTEFEQAVEDLVRQCDITPASERQN